MSGAYREALGAERGNQTESTERITAKEPELLKIGAVLTSTTVSLERTWVLLRQRWREGWGKIRKVRDR